MQILVPVTVVGKDGSRKATVFKLEPEHDSATAEGVAWATHHTAMRLLELVGSVDAVELQDGKVIRRGDVWQESPRPSKWQRLLKLLAWAA